MKIDLKIIMSLWTKLIILMIDEKFIKLMSMLQVSEIS